MKENSSGITVIAAIISKPCSIATWAERNESLPPENRETAFTQSPYQNLNFLQA
jgi:hypothetical protein